MRAMIKNITIDEKRIYTLTRYEKIGGKPTETPSDHNTIMMNIEWTTGFKNPKITSWNFKDKEAIEKFTKISENVHMKEEWREGGNADEKYKKWFQQLQTIMYKSFNRKGDSRKS